MKVFTFWHDRSRIPSYLQLCLETWRRFVRNHEITLIGYDNIDDYTDIRKQRWWNSLTRRFGLIHISDVIRVDLLSRHGGVWMDIDTIVCSDDFERTILEDEHQQDNMVFSMPESRISNAFLMAKAGSKFIQQFKANQMGKIIRRVGGGWDYFANSFSNPYHRSHPEEFKTLDISPCWPEYARNKDAKSRRSEYQSLYFKENLRLSDLPRTSLLILHNSWTPNYVKKMDRESFLSQKFTLANILGELTT